MKSKGWYMCPIVISLISTVTFAEILTESDWQPGLFGNGLVDGTPTGSTAFTMVDGTDNFGWGYAYGYYRRYTTELALCEYEATLTVSAGALLWPYEYVPSYTTAEAWASFQVDSNFEGDFLEADAYVDVDSPRDQYGRAVDWEGPFDVYESSVAWFGPGEGVKAEHEVGTAGFISEGSLNWGHCGANATGSCDLYEF